MKRLLNTLYVTNPDAMLRKKDDAVAVYLDGNEQVSIPFHLLEGIVIYGHAGFTNSLLGSCAEHGVGVVILDERGRFKCRVEGPVSGNVLLRKAQYEASALPDQSLAIAKRFVMAKVHNSRIVLQHAVRDHPTVEGTTATEAIESLQISKSSVSSAMTLDELRGVEGDAAHVYFSAFGMLLSARGITPSFAGRNRRPPRDPVNAALSFFYTMLAREIGTACESVGLDPQVGYLHACRPGRDSLALDLIEELRAPVVDRFVLSLFNRGQLSSKDFEESGGAIFFKDAAFKDVLALWQTKKQEEIMHPFLKERIQIGLIPQIQAQLLARYLRGNLDDYPAFLWR